MSLTKAEHLAYEIDAARSSGAVKLFRVWATLPFLNGHTNVPATFFRPSRPAGEFDYASLIEGYGPDMPDRGYTEAAIDEYFTESEAIALAAWLRAHDYPDVQVIEVHLPLERGFHCPLSQCGGSSRDPEGSYDLPDGETLPFRVRVYYHYQFPERPAAIHEPDNDMPF